MKYSIFNVVGLCFVLVATIVKILDLDIWLASRCGSFASIPYNMAWALALIGAVVLVPIRLRVRVTQKMSVEQTRLCSISLTSATILALFALLLYLHKGYWILPVSISAMLEVYVSFRSKE